MPTPVPAVTLVLTDERSDGRAAKAAARAVGVSRAGTALVLVTTDSRALSGALARRVRVVRVRRAGDVAATATAEAESARVAGGTALVVPCDGHLSEGWEDGVGVVGLTLGVTAPEPVSMPGLQIVGLAGRSPASSFRISAVLIVKDEERVLAECLTALEGAVDEVVVYDTGSTDRTRDIAAEHGAVVVQGYWDDHFGNARNRALVHATGEWVLSVDADEVLTGDAAAVRRTCAAAAQGLARVPILSTSWTGAADGQHSHPVRLFRRGAFEWKGALHEYLELLPGTPVVTDAPSTDGAWLTHSGYQYLTFSDRDKPQRNLEIARAAVDALPTSGEDPTMVWDAYGRSLFVAGRYDDAMEALDQVLELQANPSAVVQAGRAALQAMRERGDYSRGPQWVSALAAHGESPAAVEVWRARLALADGDLDAVDRHLAAAGRAPRLDRWDVTFGSAALDDVRAEMALRAGRPQEALEVLLSSLQRDPDHAPLSALVLCAVTAGMDLGELACRVPEGFVGRSAQEACVLPPEQGHAWLWGLHQRLPESAEVVVAGTVVGARGSLEQAVAWSSAARPLGLGAFCPLRAIGTDTRRSPLDRVLAWSLVAGVAHDDDAPGELASLLSSLPPATLVEVAAPAAELVPAVTDVIVRAVDAAALQLV